jgi:hypothetical protein
VCFEGDLDSEECRQSQCGLSLGLSSAR